MIENSMEWKIRETKFSIPYQTKEYETIIATHNQINLQQITCATLPLCDYYCKRSDCVKAFILHLTQLKIEKKDENGIAEVST